MRPHSDVEMAKRRGLRFYVSRKAKRGGPWERLFATGDLDEALSRAQATHDHEVAVFVESQFGGFLYWTSKHPETFNSVVIQPQ